MARRPHGTGSVYFDKTKDRWVGTYEAGWTKRGTRRRRSVSAKTERGARQTLLAAIRTAEEAEAPATGGKPTVKRWADVWLEQTKTALRPGAWATDRSQVNNWIVPAIGHRRLDQLGPADVRAVHRAMHTAGGAPSSIRRAHAVLGKMLKDAILAGHRVPQGALLVDGPGVGTAGRDAIALIDALAILAVASKRPDASRWVAALLQGMRPAECLGLTWEAVDLEANTLTISWQLKALPYNALRDRTSGFRVPIGYEARQLVGAKHLVRPKTSAGWRVVPLVPWMAAAMTAWREAAPTSPHGLVWPQADGAPRSDKDDRAVWREVCRQAGLEVVPDLYAARHTTATLLREGRVDDETIKAVMGHASILSTRDYLHTDTTRTRAALEQIAGRLELGL